MVGQTKSSGPDWTESSQKGGDATHRAKKKHARLKFGLETSTCLVGLACCPCFFPGASGTPAADRGHQRAGKETEVGESGVVPIFNAG